MCLTCKACETYCPADVDYVGFVRQVREAGRELGEEGRCTHLGIFQHVSEIHQAPDLKQNRLEWLTPDLRVTEKGEFVLFVGCSPYFEPVFSQLGVSSTASAKGAIRILNRMGIEPVVLPDERCCGHDQYWGGDMDGFRRLAERNVELLKEAGAKTIVTACPECRQALGELYESALGEVPFNVMHFYEFLLENKEQFSLRGDGSPVTFHDPCRLAKHMGVLDWPRRLLELAGRELHELPRSGKDSVCCGTPGWHNCGLASKKLQKARLEEAVATGSETLVTACPKCLIHLSCAKKDLGTPIELLDLVDLLSRSLG